MNYNYTGCCWFPTSSNILILPSQFWQIRFESCWLHCSKCRILVLLRYAILLGAECYRYGHLFLPLKTNSRHFFLPSYGAKCCRHLFLPLKTSSRHLFLPSNRAECYRHLLLPLKTNSRHLFFTVKQSPMLGSFTSDAKDKLPTFIFTIKQSRKLRSFTSSTNNKLPTFIFIYKRSRMSQSLLLPLKTNSLHIYFLTQRVPLTNFVILHNVSAHRII